MPKDYIVPFIVYTKSVINNVIPGADANDGRPHLLNRDENNGWDISAIIGIAGDGEGAVAISMNRRVACRIYSIFTGSKSLKTDIDEDVRDGIGEIVNMIVGNAKKDLEEFRLMITTPTIITGADHTISWPGVDKAKIMTIPFTVFGDEAFNVSIALHIKEESI